MNPLLSINGTRAIAATVRVPFAGVWYADLDLDEDVTFSGAVEVRVGSLVLRGTIAPAFSGSFQLAARYRVIGGAYGWQKRVSTKPYHNDAGVKRSTVALDVARQVDETLVLLVGVDSSLPADFPRQSAPASRILAQLFPSTPWWVGYDGQTSIGPRAQVEGSTSYDLLDYDPRQKIATVACDDPGAIGIGSVLRNRLSTPLIVRRIEIVAAKDALRMKLWGREVTKDQLRDATGAIVRETFPRYDFLAKYRYRVVKMNPGDDRTQLQAVRKLAGLPDLLPVSILPGMAGLSAMLTPGSIVLVEFIEGDPSLPIVSHFEAKGGAGFLPVSLFLDATSAVNIGATAGAINLGDALGAVVRYGDQVAIASPNPVAGVISFTPGPPGFPLLSKVKA